MAFYRCTRRGIRILVILFLCSIGVSVFVRWRNIQRTVSGLRLPPLYQKVREKENTLPHYQEYEHKKVKYFFPANHARNSGWGNVMQDFVMMGTLAHATNRSYVFDDYVSNDDGSLFSGYISKLIPSHIPLSVLLGGPMVGGPWPTGDNTPLSVSEEFFYKVCPNPTVLQVSDINTNEMRFSDDVPSGRIFERWVEKINSIEDPCLMLHPSSNAIFDYWVYGSKRLLSIWPYLKNSPVVTHWGWSPLIHSAYMRNRHLLEPTATSVLGRLLTVEEQDTPSYIPELLAIHVRRGDFKNHCAHLARWSADWNAFNSFSEFKDKFDRPTDGGRGTTSEENMQLYLRRCYPTIEEIVRKVRQVRLEAADPLRYLYILTNGAEPWVQRLKSALAEDMSWDHVGSSRDLDLTWEQKFVSQGLDMAVAQRAQVFIGNGWSSMTSNVVMLRMAQGLAAETNRFW